MYGVRPTYVDRLDHRANCRPIGKFARRNTPGWLSWTMCLSRTKISPMARLSNVSEGLTQMVGYKPGSIITTYGRHNRKKSLSRVYDLPLPPPKELRPRRSWTVINQDRSARQIEDGLTPPSLTQKLLPYKLVYKSPLCGPCGRNGLF
jgi:hypothetical protein